MKLGQWLSLVLILNYACALVPAFKKTKVVGNIPAMSTTPLLNAQQSRSDQQTSAYGALTVVVNHETETELQSAVTAAESSQLGDLFAIAEGGSGPNSSRELSTAQENSAKPQAQSDLFVEQFGSRATITASNLVPSDATSTHKRGGRAALDFRGFDQKHEVYTRLGSSRTDSSLARLEMRRGSSGDLARRSRNPQQPQEVVGGPSQSHKHRHKRSQSCSDLDLIAQKLKQEPPQASGGVGLVAAPARPSPELQRAGSGSRLQRGGQVKNQTVAQAAPETGLLGRGRESMWKKIRGPVLLYSVLSAIGFVHGLVNNQVSQGVWNQPFYHTNWLEWELGAGFNVFAVIVAAALYYKANVLRSMRPMTQQLLGIPLAAVCCSAGQLLGETAPLRGEWRNGAVNIWVAGLGAWYIGQALRLAWVPSHLPLSVGVVNHELNGDQGEGV